MELKAIFLCVSAFLFQSISAQCYGRRTVPQFAPNAFNAAGAFNAPSGFNAPGGFKTSRGFNAPSTISEPDAPSVPCTPSFVRTVVGEDDCPLTITYACSRSPNGVSVLSDLGIEGEVSVSGSLPFESAVAVDGKVPTDGLAAVNYSCGDSDTNIVITQENGNPRGANAKAAKRLSRGNLARVKC